jgi:hypothetical protein
MKKPDQPVIPNHTRQFLLGRRELMRAAILGCFGYGAFSFLKHRGIAGLPAFLQQGITRIPGLASFSAAEIIADALRFGPSLLFVSEAVAADSQAPAVFRVFYATSHDSRNELHLLDYGSQYNPFSSLNYCAAGAGLQGKIRKSQGPHPIIDEWAYNILTTGKIEGSAFSGVADKAALTEEEKNRITVIAAVGMGGTEGIHRRGAIPRVGSLEYAVMASYQNFSPIGSVSIGTPVVDSSGGVSSPGTTVSNFVNAFDVTAVYMSRAREDNPVRILDDLTGDKQVRSVRDQMLDAHNLLTEQLENIKRYSAQSQQSFLTYGNRQMEGLSAMMMFADLYERGLATVGSVGMSSFDFHATDAMRAPQGNNGNMLTETSQALAGTFHVARAAFAAKRDAVVHFTTCSNRNANWVNDDSHVSTITFIIKGSDNSAFKELPAQLVLMPDNGRQVYAEGPGNGVASYSGPDAERIGMTGNATVGRMEAGIVRAAGAAVDQDPALGLEEPAAKLT